MQFLILLCYIENNRNHREERIHVLAFKIVTGFKRHFINPRLHILCLRIERFNPPIGIRFAGGDMLPALPLLLIQLNLHTWRREPGLLIKNVYAERALWRRQRAEAEKGNYGGDN